MANGDSGEFFTMHVKLIVDPVLMKISGPPIIVVNGSANKILTRAQSMRFSTYQRPINKQDSREAVSSKFDIRKCPCL